MKKQEFQKLTENLLFLTEQPALISWPRECQEEPVQSFGFSSIKILSRIFKKHMWKPEARSFTPLPLAETESILQNMAWKNEWKKLTLLL